MAVAQVLKALYGSYVPTGSYSLEFRSRKSGKTITEIFFMLPPESVSVNEKEASDLVYTIGGAYIADFGNSFKEIKVAGSSHFYYSGSSKSPTTIYGATDGTGPADFIDGYSEFFKLRFMFMRYRDYTMTKNGKLVAPDFNLQDLATTNALKQWVNQQIESGAGVLANEVVVVWHDHDYDDHFKVKIDACTVDRDKSDPWSVKYNIEMRGYEIDDRRGSTGSFKKPTLKKLSPFEMIKKANDLAGLESAETAPQTLPFATVGTAMTSVSTAPALPNAVLQSPAPANTAIDFTSPDSINAAFNLSGNTSGISILLPVEVQQDLTVFTLNQQLTKLRSELALATSKVTTGAFSMKRVFGTLVENFITTIDQLIASLEILIIPKNQFSDFQSGIVTLDEFASFETLKYYNGLRKLKLIYLGARVALSLLQDTTPKPLVPTLNNSNFNIAGSIEESEFVDQDYNTPVADIIPQFSYYTIVQGDTFQKIAQKVYDGDYSRWPEIASANNMLDSDLIDTDKVGVTIKIPLNSSTSVNQLLNNLVYEPIFKGTTQSQIDKFIHGADIDLFEGKFQIDGNYDLQTISGIPATVANIQDRLQNTQGNLNPLHPDWGIVMPTDYNQTPFAILLDRALSSMEAQAAADPRVVYASNDRKSLRIVGDALFVEMEINLIGGGTDKPTLTVPAI